ncbi:phosphatase PAP2 family protein [Nocardioides flavescens]|uniref:Phosphatase PAP2 family protein n=1 Tax=Nocardioides flavescens TaxID=2691959 RepID=A0A6L7F081_9ACTN|nr:phosphatase PAP2 family protein [Nocardioides flavescens]
MTVVRSTGPLDLDLAPPQGHRTSRRATRHGPIAQLLIAWSPLSLLLLAYAVAGWVSAPLHADGVAAGSRNRIGAALHTTAPADADRWLFGTLPSSWLQERLHDGGAHWYDAVGALVYATHFVAIPVLTAVVWFALRACFTRWLVTLLAFTLVGIGGYVVYPASPPWMTYGDGPHGVQRLSALGWEQLHLQPVADLLGLAQGISNPVAAMPSLHAGSALLVTLFLWPVVGRAARAALAAYVLLMGLTLVYTGEHYVVDVLAGWATAVVAVLTGALVARAVSRRRAPTAPRT